MGPLKRKISLVKVLLVALLAVVVLQGVLPLVALMNSGAKETLEQNEVDLDRRMVDNRQVALESEMTNQWANVANESEPINVTLEEFLNERGLSIDEFLADSQAKEDFVSKAYPTLLDYTRYDNTSGLFLVLGNGSDVSSPDEFTGLFLRDSDPTSRVDSDSDLLLERGSETLARDSEIALDSGWMPHFSLQGAGARETDDFFYEPYKAALDYPNVSPSKLGFWSMPFVLENSAVDNHKMISYSLPLEYDGQVYGVLGIEVSTAYVLQTCFSVDDLAINKTAGYAIAYANDDGSYGFIGGTGVLFSTLQASGENFRLNETNTSGLYQVEGVQQGDQGIYASIAPMTLYSSNVPYEHTNWVVCGFVTHDSIYAVGDDLYSSIATIILLCALIGLFATMGVAYGVSAPLNRLVASIRAGQKSMEAFSTSVAEIDELHRVITHLSKTEIAAQNRLNEEKERYRLAVESSNDVFFTMYEGSQTIEVVNSGRYDRTWQLDEFWAAIERHCAAKRTRRDFQALLDANGFVDEEICIQSDDYPEPHWYEMNGKVVESGNGERRCVVGYVRDIHERKMQELALEESKSLDPVTSLYRSDSGKGKIRASRAQCPTGIVAMFDISHFSGIVRDYGMAFGDVVLEEFGKLILERAAQAAECRHVGVRLGSDEFLVWMPGFNETDYIRALRGLRKDFQGIVRHNAVDLNFNAGAVVAHEADSDELLFRRVRVALAEAKRRDVGNAFWMVDFDGAVQPAPIGEIASVGFVKEASLPTLALNLLDRRLSISAGMDLLVRRSRERYSFANIAITTYDESYRAARLFYLYSPIEGIDAADFVTRFTEEEAERLQQISKMGRIIDMNDMPGLRHGSTALLRAAGGVVFPMTNNGHYSGGIFLAGIDTSVLDDKEAANELWELGTIVQNRINQEMLDQSARAKSDFLARMSHEIRTPMNGIIGMTDIALQPQQTEQRRVDCLKKVRSSSNYLLSLLNDILDMSKIENGKMTLVKTAFSLSDMLDDLHSVLDGRFADRNQRFACNVTFINPYVVGDVVRLKQVLINLLGNASKYSAPGSKVTLTVRECGIEDGDAVLLFAVDDQGIGIAPENLGRIFGKFEQVDTTNAWQHGSGLGLPISNHLVHLMGGSIEVTSTLGEGSTFSFTLRMPVAERAEEPEEFHIVPEKFDFKGLPVLVAEDNELNMEILNCILGQMGCAPYGVSDGKQAVEAFEASEVGYYRIILMDVMMPVMGGLEAAHAIRMLHRPDAESVAIVAVSANAFAEDVHRSLASGMDAHVSKPVDAQTLGETLTRVLRSQEGGYANG